MNSIKVLYSYSAQSKKYVVEDFVEHFKYRYNFLKGVLEKKGLENLWKFMLLGSEKFKDSVWIILILMPLEKRKKII